MIGHCIIKFVVCLAILFITSPVWSYDYFFETNYIRYTINNEGKNKSLLEKKTGKELFKSNKTSFAFIKKQGKIFTVSRLEKNGNVFRAQFGLSGVQADFIITTASDYIVINLLRLYGEGIEEVYLTQLPLVPFENAGNLLASRWNKEFTISLMGLSDRVDARIGSNDMITASVHREFGMEGEGVVLIAVPTPRFLDVVQNVEHVFRLPSPKLSGKWAKLSPDVRVSYLFTDLTEANVEETIRYAKLGGFKYIMLYSSAWASSLGSYPINLRNFPRGEESLKAVIDKCHNAGIKVGMHMLTSFVSKKDPLVHPIPDKRLLKDASAILEADIDESTDEVTATSHLEDFPTELAHYGSAKAGQDILIDNEIIHYRQLGGQNSTKFIGCIRGYAGTKAAPHKSSAKIFHLAERYGSYLVDLRTSLKEELAERVAGIINRCGFDMIYFDGSEASSANGSYWYWVSQQQMDIWKRIQRDVLVQGSAITPWMWHIFARGTCGDFSAAATKKYLEFRKISDLHSGYAKNFLPSELGWWGFFVDTPDHLATMPDEVEYYAVRMLALDTPVSLETNLRALKANGRTNEMLGLLHMYEQLRLQNVVPPSVRELLRKGEWHLIWKGNKPEFHPIRYDLGLISTPGSTKIKNEFVPQAFKFRLQSASKLAKPGDSQNIILHFPDNPKVLKSAALKTTMSGALIERIDYTKPAGERINSLAIPVAGDKGKVRERRSLDLTAHRALAVKLRVDGPLPKSGESFAVLNIQLESGGKWYRDHYIDLDFTGERTIIIPGPTTERMLSEFRPTAENYSFIAAMYGFDYRNVVALNLRWMRQPASKDAKCRVGLVEALAEKESVLKNPSISIGTSKVSFPVTLNTGDYVEFWGEDKARVFNRNGVQLSTVEVKSPPILQKGNNKITLDYEGEGAAKLTTIFLGEALKY